jgi:hypothetical protein
MLRHEHDPEPHSQIRSDPQTQQSVEKPVTRSVTTRRSGRQSSLTPWMEESLGRRTIDRFRIGIVLCILSFLLALPTTMLLWRVFPSLPMLGFTLGGVMMFGGLLGLPATLIAMYWKIAQDAGREPMPQGDDVRAIGPLLDRSMTDILHTSELRQRLIPLLLRSRSEDAALLEPRQFEMLNAFLHQQAYSSRSWQRGEKAYLLAVLDAYARIGDGRALPDVARIAQGKVAYVLRDPEVREAAQRCLPHLEQAAEALRQKETLLRTSEAPAAQDMLLRPTAFTPDPDPNHLLRPADTDENS